MEAATAEKPPTIIRIEEGETATEVLAEEIEKIATAAEALLNNSGLSRRAILVLLRDRTALPMGQIDLVLESLPELRSYLA